MTEKSKRILETYRSILNSFIKTNDIISLSHETYIENEINTQLEDIDEFIQEYLINCLKDLLFSMRRIEKFYIYESI